MAQPPNPEPYKTLCVNSGLLTSEKAEELVKLQAHMAQELDVATPFLELCINKKELTAEQAHSSWFCACCLISAR